MMTYEEWFQSYWLPNDREILDKPLTEIGMRHAWNAAQIEALRMVRELVNEQAKDEGLWFRAATAPEGYLQQELRRLHAIIEENV